MPARVFLAAASLLLGASCGGTNTTSVESGSDASTEWILSEDGTVPDGEPGTQDDATDAGGVQGSMLDAGLDVAPSWPSVDSACSPPPFDAGAEAGVRLTDASPSTVTTLPDGGSARFVAVDDTTAYWTDSTLNSVWSAPLTGGPPQLIADVGTPGPSAIAVDDTYVFWVSHGGQRVLRCPKGAASCMPFVVLAPFNVGGIALDARNVYATVGHDVVACAKTGCRNAPTTVAAGVGTPYDITVQGDTLYMLDYAPDTGGGVQAYADVVKCPVTGCGNTPTILASDDSPSGLASDGRYVYWVSQVKADPSASIKRCAVCGCGGTPEVLLPADAGVMTYTVLTDGTHLFFMDGLSSIVQVRLLACSIDGCGGTPTQVLAGLPPWSYLALGPGRFVISGSTQILAGP